MFRIRKALNRLLKKDMHLLTMALFGCGVLVTCMLSISSSYALPKDKNEKIYVIADSTIYNYKTGVNMFEGHVKVRQGTTHITAEKLITKNNSKHKIEEAIAYGIKKAAHYWTTPSIGDPPIHAHANIIKFDTVNANITLEKQVFVTQAENSFQGQIILYNMTTQTITVPPSKEGRAVLVYHPEG
jgi:lipopolysaccharide export system protein LptA